MVSVERIKTNHMLLDDLGLWDEFRINKTHDSSVVQRYYNLLKELIDNQLSSTKSWLNTTEARNYFFNGAKYQREVFSALEEDLDELLEKIILVLIHYLKIYIKEENKKVTWI